MVESCIGGRITSQVHTHMHRTCMWLVQLSVTDAIFLWSQVLLEQGRLRHIVEELTISTVSPWLSVCLNVWQMAIPDASDSCSVWYMPSPQNFSLLDDDVRGFCMLWGTKMERRASWYQKSWCPLRVGCLGACLFWGLSVVCSGLSRLGVISF